MHHRKFLLCFFGPGPCCDFRVCDTSIFFFAEVSHHETLKEMMTKKGTISKGNQSSSVPINFQGQAVSFQGSKGTKKDL